MTKEIYILVGHYEGEDDTCNIEAYEDKHAAHAKVLEYEEKVRVYKHFYTEACKDIEHLKEESLMQYYDAESYIESNMRFEYHPHPDMGYDTISVQTLKVK